MSERPPLGPIATSTFGRRPAIPRLAIVTLKVLVMTRLGGLLREYSRVAA